MPLDDYQLCRVGREIVKSGNLRTVDDSLNREASPTPLDNRQSHLMDVVPIFAGMRDLHRPLGKSKLFAYWPNRSDISNCKSAPHQDPIDNQIWRAIIIVKAMQDNNFHHAVNRANLAQWGMMPLLKLWQE